jgi:hypothetical protein
MGWAALTEDCGSLFPSPFIKQNAQASLLSLIPDARCIQSGVSVAARQTASIEPHSLLIPISQQTCFISKLGTGATVQGGICWSVSANATRGTKPAAIVIRKW